MPRVARDPGKRRRLANLPLTAVWWLLATGLPALKDEIAKFYDGLTTDHVIVTSGGSEAIFSIYAALCKPGDHMVCEAPNYPSNYGIPEGLGMEYSLCHMKFEDDYRLDMDAIKAMVTDKTKVLSICHPNNPTGCTLTEPELHEIVDFCREKDIYLLSDETYREMCVARTACCLACPATRLCLRWNELQQDACSRSAAPFVLAPGE